MSGASARQSIGQGKAAALFLAACAFLARPAPAETIKIGVVKSTTSAPVYVAIERFLRAYRKGARLYHDAVTGPDERVDVKDVLHQIAWFRTQGMVKGDLNPEDMIDRRYIIPLPAR